MPPADRIPHGCVTRSVIPPANCIRTDAGRPAMPPRVWHSAPTAAWMPTGNGERRDMPGQALVRNDSSGRHECRPYGGRGTGRGMMCRTANGGRHSCRPHGTSRRPPPVVGGRGIDTPARPRPRRRHPAPVVAVPGAPGHARHPPPGPPTRPRATTASRPHRVVAVRGAGAIRDANCPCTIQQTLFLWRPRDAARQGGPPGVRPSPPRGRRVIGSGRARRNRA